MKTHPLLVALVGLFALSSMGTVLLATRHFFAVVELQKLQAQSIMINTTLNSAQSLANEAIQYTQRNPAITSVLERFKMKGSADTGTPTSPIPSAHSPIAPAMINQ